MEVNGDHQLFDNHQEMTWGWVNDDNIFIFGWTISLMIVTTVKLQKGQKHQKSTIKVP